MDYLRPRAEWVEGKNWFQLDQSSLCHSFERDRVEAFYKPLIEVSAELAALRSGFQQIRFPEIW